MQRGELREKMDFNNSDLDILVALGNNDCEKSLPPCESRSTEIFSTYTNRYKLLRHIYSLCVQEPCTLVIVDPHPWPCYPEKQPSSVVDADAGEGLCVGEADGQYMGVGGSDRWRLGENEDHDHRWGNRWREHRADQERRGVGRRGDMGVPYRNDSQAEVPGRVLSRTASTPTLPTYCKLY